MGGIRVDFQDPRRRGFAASFGSHEPEDCLRFGILRLPCASKLLYKACKEAFLARRRSHQICFKPRILS